MSDPSMLPARNDVIFLVVVLPVAAALMLVNLGNQYLWQDEAETALLARSVLHNGVPTAFDGRNLISQEDGREFGPDYVWFWTPWLQHYVVAASFAMLGESTFAARLPFALLGLVTIVATYFLSRRVAGRVAVARFATVVLTFNVPFLLHMRQCRYHAAMTATATVLLWAYMSLLQRRRFAWPWMIVAGTLLFHANYVAFLTLWSVLAIHYVLFARRAARGKALLGAVAATAVLIGPFAYWFIRQTAPGPGGVATGPIHNLRVLLHLTNRHVLPLVVLMVPIVLAWGRWWGRRIAASSSGPSPADPHQSRPDPASHGTSLLIVTVTVGVLAPALLMPLVFFRYVLLIIPVAAVLLGLIVDQAWRRHRLAGGLLLVLLAGTDLLHRAASFEALRPSPEPPYLAGVEATRAADVVGTWAACIPLAALVHELCHDYDGPVEALVRYLRINGRPEDTVVTTYADLPLKFYTKMKVIGGLSAEDPAAFGAPRWVIPRAWWRRTRDARLQAFVNRCAAGAQYRPITLSQQDLPFENRPDPRYHKFRTVAEGNATLVIYERVDSNSTR